MLDQVEELASQANSELRKITSLEELELWRVRYLGRKSKLINILRSLGDVPIDERRALGARANQIKTSLEGLCAERKEQIQNSAHQVLERAKIDVTLPGEPYLLGRLHPTTRTIKEICDIFVSMGFQIVEGPEVEWEYYNFEALNMPAEHPARDGFATLWVDYQTETGARPMLMRTHTSPVQIRTMEKVKPPVRVVAPGRVYRYEATDATHEWMFSQVEGFAVDRNITMADLKGTLFEFARRLFGQDRKCRFRCDYFPFVEPGVEIAIDCFMCGGKGCRLCSNTGWIEILGAGMIHPEVLRGCGIDPDEYSGFAFGMGVERIPILRYGIDDIRLFYANDLRFLKQF
ncbi:MAG: phenylalanine--tRNA ligase subunit alpha [Dehalococcoidia bacterium]|jgi:phenylalanyl-tRNA synthetase alpha chain